MPTSFYEVHAAPPPLAPFVRRILYADRGTDAFVRLAPSRGVVLSGTFDSGDISLIDAGRARSLRGWQLWGPVRELPSALRYRGHVGHVLVEFTPTGFTRLFKMPAAVLADRCVGLSEVNPACARRLAPAQAAGTREERLRAFEAGLAALVPNALPDLVPVAIAVTALEKARGVLRIAALSTELAVSGRHLVRLFQTVVGMPPKQFAEICRIDHALAMLRDPNGAGLTAIAHDCGFYDQAHFIKAVRRYIGADPRGYRAASRGMDWNLGHAPHVSAKAARSSNRPGNRPPLREAHR